MIITLGLTITKNNEQRTANFEKQTQTNPILLAELMVLAAVTAEGGEQMNS
jgi:hypothetical protein